MGTVTNGDGRSQHHSSSYRIVVVIVTVKVRETVRVLVIVTAVVIVIAIATAKAIAILKVIAIVIVAVLGIVSISNTPWNLAWTLDPLTCGIPVYSYCRYLKVNPLVSRGRKCHVE